jgi:hypothetical protein
MRGYSAKIIRKGPFFHISLHSENRKTECNGAEVKPCEYTIILMSIKKQIFKENYPLMVNQARQQMALMNKCRMLSRRTGRGGQQPFYMQFLNR